MMRPGYKRTEVGEIPEDWRLCRLGEVASIQAAGDLDESCFSEHPDGVARFPIYANSLARGGLYGFSRVAHYPAGSATITARGDVGHAEFRTTPFSAIGRLLVLTPVLPKLIDLRFVVYAINSYAGTPAESTGVPQLTVPQASRILIAAPRLEEQVPIADSLSDAELVIESLEHLLAKKRAIKQGAMQSLLTGAKRLPGFTDSWRMQSLCSVASFTPGSYLAASAYAPGPVPVHGAGGQMGWHDKPNIQESLTVVGRVGSVGRPRYMPSGCWVNNNAAAVIGKPGHCSPAFLQRLLERAPWQLVTSTTAQPFLEVRGLMQLAFLMPSLPEQAAIAEVLSDLDADLDATAAKLDKARAIKQGMMQELLTGRIRLV